MEVSEAWLTRVPWLGLYSQRTVSSPSTLRGVLIEKKTRRPRISLRTHRVRECSPARRPSYPFRSDILRKRARQRHVSQERQQIEHIVRQMEVLPTAPVELSRVDGDEVPVLFDWTDVDVVPAGHFKLSVAG